MERANKDRRGLVTLFGGLAAAHEGGHITGDVFWESLERIRCARQNLEDNNLQGADDAISTVLRLLWAYPGSERVLKAVVGLSWTSPWRFLMEKAAFIAKTTYTSVAATSKTDTAGAAPGPGDAQTNIVKAALQLDALAVAVERRQKQKLHIVVSILDPATSRRTDLFRKEIERPQEKLPRKKRIEAIRMRLSVSKSERKSAEGNSTVSLPESERTAIVAEPPVKRVATAEPAAAAPAALGSQAQIKATGKVTASACPDPSSRLSTKPLLSKPLFTSVTPIASIVSVSTNKDLSLSTTAVAHVASAAIHLTFDTAITPEDLENISVYEGKVDFAGRHRIKRAWDNYKQPTRIAMAAMAHILRRQKFDEADLSILGDFRERIRFEDLHQFGDIEVPANLSSNLRHAICWRELACAWYDSLQVAVEANRVPNDGSGEKLRDGTKSHKHFLVELQATNKVLKTYQSRLRAEKQEQDAAEKVKNASSVGG